MNSDLTVITVVKDDAVGLLRTRNSVKMQEGVSLQHIIVAGKSSDGTASLVNQWRRSGEIETPDGDDSGIYCAMNMGLAIARAPFVWFLNAGDSFATDKVAASAIKSVGKGQWAYGAVIPITKDGNRAYATLQPEVTLRGIRWGQRYFNHQALIMRTDFLRSIGGFNEGFKYAGEFEMYLRGLHAGLPLRVKGEWTCFEVGGISMRKAKPHLLEVYKARKMHLISNPMQACYNVWVTGYRIIRNWVGNRRIPLLQRIRFWYLARRFPLDG